MTHRAHRAQPRKISRKFLIAAGAVTSGTVLATGAAAWGCADDPATAAPPLNAQANALNHARRTDCPTPSPSASLLARDAEDDATAPPPGLGDRRAAGGHQNAAQWLAERRRQHHRNAGCATPTPSAQLPTESPTGTVTPSDPTADPTAGPTADPTTGPTTQPTSEPTSQPTQPTAQPTTPPVVTATSSPTVPSSPS